MKIAEQLQKLLELPAAFAFQEAHSKFSETYLKIDGTVFPVHSISKTGIIETGEKSFSPEDTNIIEVFLPKSGIYIEKKSNQAVFLCRRPERQWKRSATGGIYKMVGITKVVHGSLKHIPDTEPLEFYFDENTQTLFYHASKIAKITEVVIEYSKIKKIKFSCIPIFKEEATKFFKKAKENNEMLML